MKTPVHLLNKFRFSLFALILAFVLAFLSSTSYASLLVDRIVAVVENDVITETELRDRISVLRAQATAKNSALPSDDVIEEQVLQRMIIESLQVQLGERRGVKVDDLTLDQAMRNLADRNQMTLEEFRAALIEEGIDYVAFRDQVRTEMMIGQVKRRAVDNGVQISEKEIDELLRTQQGALEQSTEYHLAHILIELPQTPSPSDIQRAEKRAQTVADQANEEDSDFAQIVIRESDAQDALEGGDLGWRNKSQLPKVFAQQVDKMQAGEISPVLRTPSGYHVFKLIEIRGAMQTMVEQVHARHILVRTNTVVTEAEARGRLESLRKRLLQNESFSELARAHSEDTGSAANGGDLGWMDPQGFVPAFRDTLNNLEVDEISQPFKSRFGWHIAQVLERRQHDNSEEALRQRARQYLTQRKIEEETEIWLRRLRDESYVENRLRNNPSN